MKQKFLDKKTILYILASMVILAVPLRILVKCWQHNFYRDWEFEYYMKQFNLEDPVSGNEVMKELGEPIEIEYLKDEHPPYTEIQYITLRYDGYSFGILGDSLESWVVMVKVKKPGILNLRNHIDIGSSKSQADMAYLFEKKIVDSYGFILGEEHETADGGGTWIFFSADGEGETIKEIAITDGL